MKANRRLSLVTAISLACLSTSLAQSPKPRPGHPHQAAAFEAMRLRNADGTISTNGLINAIQQARQMQYNANAWPGAAGPKTGGIHPLVADLNTNNWQWLGSGNVGGAHPLHFGSSHRDQHYVDWQRRRRGLENDQQRGQLVSGR